jgi:hypothetical protein
MNKIGCFKIGYFSYINIIPQPDIKDAKNAKDKTEWQEITRDVKDFWFRKDRSSYGAIFFCLGESWSRFCTTWRIKNFCGKVSFSDI